MKCSKASGHSCVIAEMLKTSGEEGIRLIRQLGEEVFSNGVISSEGKGDALNCGKYGPQTY